MSTEITIRCDDCDRAGDSKVAKGSWRTMLTTAAALRRGLKKEQLWRVKSRGENFDLCPACSESRARAQERIAQRKSAAHARRNYGGAMAIDRVREL